MGIDNVVVEGTPKVSESPQQLHGKQSGRNRTGVREILPSWVMNFQRSIHAHGGDLTQSECAAGGIAVFVQSYGRDHLHICDFSQRAQPCIHEYSKLRLQRMRKRTAQTEDSETGG